MIHGDIIIILKDNFIRLLIVTHIFKEFEKTKVLELCMLIVCYSNTIYEPVLII